MSTSWFGTRANLPCIHDYVCLVSYDALLMGTCWAASCVTSTQCGRLGEPACPKLHPGVACGQISQACPWGYVSVIQCH